MLGREGVRWLGKSALGYLLGMGLLALWVDGLGVRPELAIGVNHVVIGLWNYALVDRWVFDERPSPDGFFGHLRRFAEFQAVMVTSNGAKYALFLALLWLGVWYLAAWTVAAVVLLAVSFAGSRWVWSDGSAVPQGR